MNKFIRIILMIAMVVMALPLQFISQNKADAATSGVPPAACTKTLTGTSTLPKVVLSPKPLDLVFILDASGSFTSNMPKVKEMINASIDKFVQPADGDRTMITTFQGVKNNNFQNPPGTNYYTSAINDFKITTNSSKLTSDITSVKSFVNAVVPKGGTPTPSGVTQALNDYKSVAGAATGRQTVFVLITDGVANVSPVTQSIEKTNIGEQAYIDNFKSVSTVVGTYYDSSLRQYYTQYRWARYNAVTGAFIRYEYVNDYPGTVYDQFYDAANGTWPYIYQYETSQDWKARLNDLTAAVTSVKTAYSNAEFVVGFLEDRNSFSNMGQYGPLYETTMRPQIQTTLQSYATDPSYYINTGDSTAFVNQLSSAISNAVQAVSSSGTFTLTAGYKMETMTLVNKTTGGRIPLSFTQNGTTITVNKFDYDGSEYNLEYTTQLLNPDLLVIDADPTADEIGPTLTGDFTFGTQKVTVPKFGPSSADTYQYFNCETTVKKSVKKATETSYKTPSTTLDSGTQTFSFSNDYAFNRSPLAWTTSPVLYDKIDPRLEILDVKVVALDKSGASSVPFTLGSNAITTLNNEVKVTLPADADGKFTSYLGDQYKVLITAKIKPEFTQAGALYTDIVTNGIPNQAEIITTISGATTKQSLLSNEVKVYTPNQRPWPISFQKNGVAPDGSKKGIPGAEFKITPVTTYEDASGKIVQVENGTPVTATSTSIGQVITPDLMPGVYIVEETTAPPGYVKDNSKYKITVNSDGGYTVVKIDTTGTETSMPGPLTVDNKQLKATIDLVKQSNVTSVMKAGDLITYTFTVTNTGEIALYNIKLDDPMFPQGITLSKTTLNPGESTTASVTKTVTQQEINGGDIVNTAKVTGAPPGDITPPTDEDKVTVLTPDTPAITLDKVADKSVVKEGDIVTYDFTVTNTGNVTLTNVSLNDPMLGGVVSVVKNTLLPGESTTGTAKYTVTDKDMFNPTIANTATVAGTPPSGTDVIAKDTETVTPTSASSITLDKVIQNELVTTPGQTLYYNFTVKNTGDVTLTNVTVSDPMFPGGIVLQDTTLSPGETTTGTATHTVTQAEFDSGNIKNTATVTGTAPIGTSPTSTDTVDVPTQLSPMIKLEKSTTATQVKEGDKVTYNFVVTNTGNTTLTDVVLNDPMLGGNVSLQKTTLAPGETTSGTAIYTVTTADMAKDAIKNTAIVNGKDSKGANVTDDDNAIVTPNGKPGINLDKATKILNVAKAGDIIDYQFTVTNTGDTTLTNVVVTDPMFPNGITLAKSNLAPGETTTGTAKHTVTQAEMNAGTIYNTAKATGTPPSGAPPTSTDAVTVPAIGTTGIDLEKEANLTEIKSAGELVTYTFTVTNTGTTTLKDVKVNDPLVGGPVTIQKTTLEPGETTSGTAMYTVQQSDINNGKLPNTAFAVGTAPDNLDDPSDTDSLELPAITSNGISIEKTANLTEITAPGQEIKYNFKVTNTGNTTLKDVVITDSMFPNNRILTNTVLEPGESTEGTAIHVVTQEEFDSGKLVNIAKVTGTPPTGTQTTDTDTVEVPVKQNTSIAIKKTAGQTIIQQTGEVIAYTFVVTNTGNTTLTDIVVTDPMFPNGITIAKTTLLPGEQTIGTATHTVTQSDLNKLSVYNIATVTGKPPGDLTHPTATATDTVTIPTEHKPAIELHKHADIQEVERVGQVITYDLEIFNTGNVTLTNIELTDLMFGGVIKLDNTTLQPGEKTEVQFQHVVTQDEFERGEIVNTANVTGLPPVGPKVTDEETEVVNTHPTANITLDKSSDLTTVTKAGERITYKFVVTNTGTSTLTNVTLTDEKLGGSITLEDTILAPGESTTITKSYTVTQEDINNGEIINTASVTGAPPAGLTPPTATDDNRVVATGTPDIIIVKSVDKQIFKVGDTLTYSFVITNTGNVTLTNVHSEDLFTGQNIELDKTVLEPGEQAVGTIQYVATQQDVDRGRIDNKAVVAGTPPGNLEPPFDNDTVTVTSDRTASISLDKSSANENVKLGETITYTFKVQNTGTTTLTDVIVTDPMFPDGITLTNTTLLPGEETTGSATKVVTQADIDRGVVTNTATTTGTPPVGLTPPTATDTVDVSTNQQSTIDLEKTADKASVALGDNITYTFTVTNTGNTTLTDVKVTDAMFSSVTLDKATLAPGETATGTATKVVTQQDIDAGVVTNTATATATSPSGTSPTDKDTVEVPTDAKTSIKIDKTTDATGLVAGQSVNYKFLVTNTGSVTLKDVIVTDPMFGGNITLSKTTLAPGESATGTASHVVTQSEVDAGKLTNTALTTGKPPGGLTPPKDKDTVEITQSGSARITLDKTSDKTAVNGGETINYTFNVKNTGTTTLTKVTVTDPMFPEGIRLLQTTLAPGESTTGTASKVVTQADIDGGLVTNTATTTGTPPNGLTPPTATDTVEVPANQTAAIEIDKEAVQEEAKVGEAITYTFKVTNTGTVTLKDVKVNDEMFPEGITLEKTTLAPGESTTGTATKTVTQADMDKGSVSNTATTTGTPPGDITPPTNEDTVIVPAKPVTSIELDKSTNNTELIAGETVTYQFKVTNTGNVTLTNVEVTDPMFDGITLNKTTLAPGESTTGTASKVITQADVDAGSLVNKATATGTPPGELTPPKAEDTVTINQERLTNIDLEKTADKVIANVGDPINYTFKVTNTGNVTLTNVSITDPMFNEPVTLLETTLLPGQSTTGKAIHIVTQADIDAGFVLNTATTTGTPPTGLIPPTDKDSVKVPTDSTASIELDKTSNATGLVVGSTIEYGFTVTNTGTVTLKDVKVTDPMFPNGITLDKTTLAPGESTTGTASKVITQADVDAGKVTNTARVEGTPPGELTPPTDEDTVVITQDGTPAIALEKSADKRLVKVGDSLEYTFKVTNTGTVSLNDVKVTDPMFQDGIILGKTTLAPGESTTGTAIKVVTQEDVDNGFVTNTATTTGTPPGDVTPPTDDDTVKVETDSSTAITLDKSANQTSVKVGDTIDYTFNVKNTGTTTLTNVTVTDAMFPEGITLLSTTLAPGESTTGKASKVVTQADIDGGKVTNTASVTGTPPGSLTSPTATDTVDVPTDQQSAIDLEKTADQTSVKVGDTITYTFTVTNTGAVTLKDVSVTDVMFPEGITLDKTTLAPGETTTGTASKVVTQADIDGGKVTNTANVTGTPPGDTPPPTDEDTVEVPTNPSTSITLDKATTATGLVAGETVDYTFTVTNTGNVTLKDVIVTDPMFGGNITLGKTTLVPGESTTGTASHVVTQAEVDAGQLENVAITTGTPPGDLKAPTAEDKVVITQDGTTAITLDKSANQTSVKVGDTIDYTFNVKNTGTTTLTNVTVTDAMFPEGITLLSTTLAPGESTTGKASKVVTQADIDGGKVTNTASVTGTPPGSLTPPTAADTVDVPVEIVEPTTEEPTTEEPTTEEPTTEEPTTEEPTTEEPTTEEPTTEEPTTEEPTTEEPTTEEPTTEEPTTEEPTTEEPTTEEPTTEEPTTEEATTEEPTTEEPTTEEPITEEPTTEEPTTEEPTTEEPTTEAPTTEEPTTEGPTTEGPGKNTYSISDFVWNDENKNGVQDSDEIGISGVTVILTKPDGTKISVVTDQNGHYIFTGLENGEYTVEFIVPNGFEASPIGQASLDKDSNGKVTKVIINNSDDDTVDMGIFKLGGGGTPTTELPTTEVPTTELPTTELPTTELPTTEVPTTELPTTEEPTTEAPTTEAPTTEAPTTEVPTTEAPTTEEPTTEEPTTEAPTTEVPTTELPTTEAPTTEVPTTELPTTEAPTTEVPTTEEPTIEIPKGPGTSVTPPAPTNEIPNKPSLPEDHIVNIKPVPSKDETFLPDTGEVIKNTGLAGLAFISLGGMLLLLSRRKN